jgi:hypothetical protein
MKANQVQPPVLCTLDYFPVTEFLEKTAQLLTCCSVGLTARVAQPSCCGERLGRQATRIFRQSNGVVKCASAHGSKGGTGSNTSSK